MHMKLEMSQEKPSLNSTSVTIAYATDMQAVSPGGIQSCIWEFLKHTNGVTVKVLGVVNSNSGYPALPPNASLDAILELTGPSRLPLNLRFMGALWRWITTGSQTSEQDTIWFHRTEHLLPFVLLRHKKKHRVVVTIHGSSAFAEIHFKRRIVAKITMALEQAAIRYADAIVLVSERSLEHYQSLYPWARHKISVVPNPVDLELFTRLPNIEAVRQLYGLPSSAAVFSYHGRIAPEKGVELLLEAFKLIRDVIPDAVLFIIGEGPLREQLMAEVRPGVHWLGAVKHDDLPKHLNATDVALLASSFEGMPLSILESLACGVPVVSTDVGDLSLIVQPGKSGIVVKERSPAAIAAAALEVYQNRAVLAPQCRDCVLNYSSKEYTARMLAILEKQ